MEAAVAVALAVILVLEEKVVMAEQQPPVILDLVEQAEAAVEVVAVEVVAFSPPIAVTVAAVQEAVLEFLDQARLAVEDRAVLLLMVEMAGLAEIMVVAVCLGVLVAAVEFMALVEVLVDFLRQAQERGALAHEARCVSSGPAQLVRSHQLVQGIYNEPLHSS